MVGVSIHISDVKDIRTKVAEDITVGWITIEGKGDSLTMFFREVEEIEKLINALRTLKTQFNTISTEGLKV